MLNPKFKLSEPNFRVQDPNIKVVNPNAPVFNPKLRVADPKFAYKSFLPPALYTNNSKALKVHLILHIIVKICKWSIFYLHNTISISIFTLSFIKINYHAT